MAGRLGGVTGQGRGPACARSQVGWIRAVGAIGAVVIGGVGAKGWSAGLGARVAGSSQGLGIRGQGLVGDWVVQGGLRANEGGGSRVGVNTGTVERADRRAWYSRAIYFRR